MHIYMTPLRASGSAIVSRVTFQTLMRIDCAALSCRFNNKRVNSRLTIIGYGRFPRDFWDKGITVGDSLAVLMPPVRDAASAESSCPIVR